MPLKFKLWCTLSHFDKHHHQCSIDSNYRLLSLICVCFVLSPAQILALPLFHYDDHPLSVLIHYNLDVSKAP